MKISVCAFYHFQRLTRLEIKAIETGLKPFKRKDIRGLILLGSEGINATVSGPDDAIAAFKAAVSALFSGSIHFKDSLADRHPFREFKIRMRKEIVTLGRPDLVPETASGHLSAQEWHAALSDPAAVILDTRNRYEVEIGKFKGAVDLGIDEFREFPERVKEMNLPKEQKILMYCTGGIRCEKAILEMREQGYENVYQLQGGILEYLKEFPEQSFEGECFVFDYRVAVDQKLRPSERFRLCPHCGQPGSQRISCVRCGQEAIVCSTCVSASPIYSTCSKNCAHHEEIQSGSRKPHLQELTKRQSV